jgi:hypothetical protein
MESTHLQKRLCQAPSCIMGEFCLDVAYSLATEDIPYKPKYKVPSTFPIIKSEKKKSFLTEEVKLILLRSNIVFFIFILNALKIRRPIFSKKQYLQK